jgi:hypothetical protein
MREPSYYLGQWANRGTRWHIVQSKITDRYITRCGRQMRMVLRGVAVLVDVVVGQRGDPHADVTEQRDEGAARPGEHDRPERRVVRHADHHLDAVRDHLLHEELVRVLA